MGMIREAITNLSSSISFMAKNNSEGQFDTALDKHTRALSKQKSNYRYFLSEVPEREYTAAEAA